MLDMFAPRPAEDILSRTVRVALGNREFELAVLFIAGNERWKKQLDADASEFVGGLAASKSTGEVLAALSTQTEKLLDLLISYDTDCGTRPGALPSRDEIKEFAYEGDLLAAVREVWRAANPLVVTRAAQALAGETPTSDSSPPSSSSATPTAYARPKRSARH